MLMALEPVPSGETYVPAVALTENDSHFGSDNPLSELTRRMLQPEPVHDRLVRASFQQQAQACDGGVSSQ